MSQPKPLASLTATLLARKGHARPAMRPQVVGAYHQPSVDDLGWNDLGQEPARSAEPLPPVLVQREVLREELVAPQVRASAAVQPVSVATAARLQRDTERTGKAAFTLRLDPDRHLRLRLASAITNLSAQQLMAGALDQMLAGLPEVETLVAQLAAAPSPRNSR